MDSKQLKFPIEVHLTKLVLDFGELSPQLIQGRDLNGQKLIKIIENACGIRKEFREYLVKLEDRTKIKQWQKYLTWMTRTITEANRKLNEERRYENNSIKHRKICQSAK